MRLWAWGQSDPGRKRERNEDSYLVDPETGVMAVADGMGGHAGGATASRMAVELLGREIAETCGNFEQAFVQQLKASMRTTEEMTAATEEMAEMGRAATPVGMAIPIPHGSTDIGLQTTLPHGAVVAFSPALEVMRAIVKRASSAIY